MFVPVSTCASNGDAFFFRRDRREILPLGCSLLDICEVAEETGLELVSYRARGIVTFCYGEDTVEYMHLYTAEIAPDAEPGECDEGTLEWIDRERIAKLPIWEGDRVFFRLLRENRDWFSLKLVYDLSDELTEVQLDGAALAKGEW